MLEINNIYHIAINYCLDYNKENVLMELDYKEN